MKSPLDKLRKFALYKNDSSKDKRNLQSSAQLDELAQAAKDMQEMRECYDSLLSAAAATANSAYVALAEFSESLREMGTCLLEKTALHDDEDSGRVLLMLGKSQFELQKLVDSYRSHIFLTITNPSESLLNELRTVEEMKRQCDEKRSVYQYMVDQQKEKGKPKGSKTESFSSQHLRAAHEAYDEEATLCVFRLKSLKQGQSRSLLTQAARHHAAQLNFFRKGLKSLEAIEPHLRVVTEQQHIEYQFSGLEDNDGEDAEDDGENENDSNEYRELSFDYRPNRQGLDVSTSRNSMEVDDDGNLSPQPSKVENTEMILDRNQGDFKVSSREPRVSSYSAPVFAEKKFDPAEKARQMQLLSARKSHTYVLPTPTDAMSFVSSRNSSSAILTKPTGRTHNLWHSSPLDEKKLEKDIGDVTFSATNTSKAPLVLKESGARSSTQLPPPLAEGLALSQLDTVNTSDSKKIKRHAFSGPLTSKPSSTKPVASASAPIVSAEIPQLASGVASRLQMPQSSSSPKVSPSASPPLASSPRISELHELPRPPGSFAAKASRSPGLVGHSAPLGLRNQELGATNRLNIASPLPTPPLFVPRSYSIPSRGQREMALHVSKHFESPRGSTKAEDVASPPLTPISLSNINPVPTVSEVSSQSSPIQAKPEPVPAFHGDDDNDDPNPPLLQPPITLVVDPHSSRHFFPFEIPAPTLHFHTQFQNTSLPIPKTSPTSLLRRRWQQHFIVDFNSSVLIQKKAMDISPELKGTSIFLVGMNSPMKTSLGKLLAKSLRYYYFDSDSLVEEAAGGESAVKSFRETDEQGFRASETEVLKQLSSMGRLVVCAGNGAVQSSTNLALLRHGITIWIDVPLDMMASGNMEDQSVSDSEVFTQLASLYEEMREGYATADTTISLQKVASKLGYDDVNAVTTEDMTLEVLKEIERLTRVKKMMEEAARPF
ncbi:hypothetical protein G4B88_027282 [Cannabis sativa]|uniref:Uncharacterized protein n=1 Tax=Cannabis sativa TaxID=3483 RepID=A0A7J6HQH9_CANSA|nr:hypothetical protein G4B88_027282 [Cannabis sativa]